MSAITPDTKMSQTTSPWKNIFGMSTERVGCAAVASNGKLFIAGGYGSGEEDSIEFFDVAEEWSLWTRSPSKMSEGRSKFAAAAIGNTIYVVGGKDGFQSYLKCVEAFDIRSGLWRTVPPLSTYRDNCAAVAVGDELFVFGGNFQNTAESFNVNRRRWMDLPPMNTSRSGCAAAVIKNKIYVVGGSDGSSILDTLEVFDLSTRTWTLLPHRMAAKRHGFAAAAVGNYLVVAGGSDGVSRLNTAEMYDVDKGTWTELPPMSTERYYCAAVSLCGNVYVMGGMTNDLQFLNSVERIPISDDAIRGLLYDWTGGPWTWSNDVAPLLHWRTSIVHKMDVDVTLMPTLLSGVGREERVQTMFEILRDEMSVFKHTWSPKKRQKRCN